MAERTTGGVVNESLENILEERLLFYLQDENYWKQWRMEKELSRHEAAALLPAFLSTVELETKSNIASFWTLRAANFFTCVQNANWSVYGRWGKPAGYMPWNNFLKYISKLPSEKGLLLFPGKHRTLPTSGHRDNVIFGRRWHDESSNYGTSALIFEPKENVNKLEGNKLVFSRAVRAWAYSLLPVDIVTSYPIMESTVTDVNDSFYSYRNAELRKAYQGPLAVAMGDSQYRKLAVEGYERHGIKVLDTSMSVEPNKSISSFTTSELDQISSTSEYIGRFILSFLKHTGQIK